MNAGSRSRLATARNLAILAIVWEIVGRFDWVAQGALPAPSEIAVRFWSDRADYPAHILETMQSAIAGFAIGNIVAILCGILFVLSPLAARVARGFNIAIFALPPIAIVPILVLTLDGLTPRVTLAALACYFTTMTATMIGLTQIDRRAVDVVRAYGGNRWLVLRLIQLRGALPTILSGLRVAAPNAVLGAILAEFGGGGRWGLGTYLLGSLGRADPARLWSIGLIATLIAGIAYGTIAIIAERLVGATRAVTVPASPPPVSSERRHPIADWAIGAAALALPFAAWWLLLRGLDVPELIAKTPMGVFDYLFLAENSGEARARLLAALGETLPVTLLGMAAGLGFAFILAISSQILPTITRSFLPVALVTQSMPLVALTPLLVLLFGRGLAVTLAVTISVTFFPAFVTIVQGLIMVPRAALDLPRAYGASPWTEMRLVAIPASLPYLFAAARLAVPRALLGVMIAEWLATGTGLGNLLNQSRGYLDFGMIWTVAAASVLVSVLFYYAVVGIERATLSRLGMAIAD